MNMISFCTGAADTGALDTNKATAAAIRLFFIDFFLPGKFTKQVRRV